MEDREIIEVLEKIIEGKMLGSDQLRNATMCLDSLKSNDEANRNNAIGMARHLLKATGFMKLDNLPNRFDVEKRDNELLNNIPKLVEEIRSYLATKQLDSDLALCLEFVIEDLTNEQKSKEEKLEVIRKYYREYKPAITCANEYIPKSSNHRK